MLRAGTHSGALLAESGGDLADPAALGRGGAARAPAHCAAGVRPARRLHRCSLSRGTRCGTGRRGWCGCCRHMLPPQKALGRLGTHPLVPLPSPSVQHLAGYAEWSLPQAGMFLWLRLLTVRGAEEARAQGAACATTPVAAPPTVSNAGPCVTCCTNYSTNTHTFLQPAPESLACRLH